MSSPQNNDHKSSEGCQTLSPKMLIHHHQQQHQQQQLFHLQQQMQSYQKYQQQQQQQQRDIQSPTSFDSESYLAQKRKLYAIKEQTEEEQEDEDDEDEDENIVVGKDKDNDDEDEGNAQNKRQQSEVLDNAYDADVDDDIPISTSGSGMTVVMTATEKCETMRSDVGSSGGVGVVGEKAQRVFDERQHIYEVSKMAKDEKKLKERLIDLYFFSFFNLGL